MEESSNNHPNFVFEEENSQDENELSLGIPSPIPNQQAPSPIIHQKPLTF